MHVELKCAEPGHTDKSWRLDIQDSVAVLCTPAGDEIARFSHDDARKVFETPALNEAERHFRIRFGEQIVRFDISLVELKEIERFLNRDAVNHILGAPAAPAVRAASRDPRVLPVRLHRTASGPAISARPQSAFYVTPPVKVVFRVLRVILGVFGILYMLGSLERIVTRHWANELDFVTMFALSAAVALGLLISVACLRPRPKKRDELY